MEMRDQDSWDEERYLELNTYFRYKIQGIVDTDPHIKDLMKQEEGLQLQDLIERMSQRDQELWKEFIQLDRIKLNQNMKNHLEGKGNPYNPRHGFSDSEDDEENKPTMW
jgi:hypothetical protein